MQGDREQRLQAFVAWSAANITGDEKGEAQIFLDRLLQAFAQPGVLETGKAEFRIKKGKEAGGGTSFADFVWKPLVLVEMKKRGVDLRRTYQQAFDYWTRLVPGRPHYVVLCNFDEFWVYDFDVQLDEPLDIVRIEELPSRWAPLAFLYPTNETPKFKNNQEEVTRRSADRLAELFNKLTTRGVDRERAQRFTLQSLVALFAEDIKLLEPLTFARLLDECDTPARAYDLIGQLFVEMNTPGRTAGGRFKGVDYFNGGLFAEPVRLELHADEVKQLSTAAEDNWSNVRPEIFGTLFEHSIDADERHAYGAHFTAGTDIMKIVRPTIIDPWERLIDRAKTQAELRTLHERLQHTRVLDPACGSGNFLYLAYRAMKRLEQQIFDRMDELSSRRGARSRRLSFVTAQQFYGMDINPFAVELAKVTMMIARKLAIDELQMQEPALPLDNLDGNFTACDALITFPAEEEPVRTPWPEADVIIGNPPFLGAKRLKPERGPDYVNAVRKLYPEVPGMADYCVYWFRRAHDHLPVCTPENPTAGRAGLVGTQNIRNNKSRVGGMDHIVASGTVVEAVDNQPWSGEANVHVSIANWVKHPPQVTDAELDRRFLVPAKRQLWQKVDPPAGAKRKRKKGDGPATKEYELDVRDAAQINSALSDQTDVSGAARLAVNSSDTVVCCQGVTPGHSGFIRTPAEAIYLLQADSSSSDVCLPYLVGRELLTGNGQPSRFVIDFGDRSIIDSQQYAAAFSLLQSDVLPDIRERASEKPGDKSRSDQLERWWKHWRNRGELIELVRQFDRYLVCSRVTKRPIFAFVGSCIRPGDALQCFTFDDDYSFGVLQSNSHWQWFTVKCSKLAERFRYTPESVFDTFPWPQSPTVAQIDSVAEAGREVRRVRDDALTKIKGGLRAVYRTLELPGKNPLKDAHTALDATVLKAYGFSARKDLLKQLLELNQDVAARIDRGEAVTAPGVPAGYPEPQRLVTGDCIRPAE